MIEESEKRPRYHELTGEVIGHAQEKRGHLTYIIELRYEEEEWRIDYSYEKFEEFIMALSTDFAALPSLPPRFPADFELSPEDIEEREDALEKLLQEILKRKDILGDDRANEWLELNSHGIKYKKIKPTSVTHVDSVEENLTISKFLYSSDRGVLVTTYEDMTFLSKFGKMWSIIDKSQVGAYIFWRRVISPETNLPIFEKVFDKVYEQRITSLLPYPELNLFLLAFDSGALLLIEDISEEGYDAYKEVSTIKLQNDRIMDMQRLGDMIVLISYGNALKIFDPKKREIVGGGSLKARLGERNLHSLLVDERGSRIYLGTSSNLILIYNLAGSQPKYAGAMESRNAGPIQTMHINRGNLFCGDGKDITTWSILLSKNEKIPKNTAVFSIPKEQAAYFEDAIVTSIANVSEHDCLFAGYSNGTMLVWNTKSGNVVSTFYGHSDRVTQITYLQDRDVLITSSNDIKFWKVGEIQLDAADDEEEEEEENATGAKPEEGKTEEGNETEDKFDIDVAELEAEVGGAQIDDNEGNSSRNQAGSNAHNPDEDDELLNEIEAEISH